MHDQGQIVGREAEQRVLSQRLADAQRGQARTVLIGGEAGVGKSRLLTRFAETARLAGAQVLVGACEEHFGDPMPYGPLLEMLEALRREHGTHRAAELGGPTYQQLASFFELGSSAMNNSQQVFLAVRRMLDHIGSSSAPTVLILEDLHWADRSTLDLVRHLAQADPDDRHLLLVCSYRSRELRRGDPLWHLLAEPAFLRRTERLELPPFGKAELAEFLAGVAGGQVDPLLVQRCLDWSEGVAFLAEQLMAAGVLDDPDGIELPDNIRDVILAQLSVLGPDALRVLQVAAVAGRTVSRQLLRKVSGLTGSALHAALQDCFDRQLLVTGSHKDAYRFRHALLREAVYQPMIRDLQVDLHIAMAEALAADPQLSLTEGSAAAEQASHWYQAGDQPRALASAVQAGEAASRTLAFPAAEVQYTRSLQLWQQVADPAKRAGMSRGQLLAAAAEAARWSGHLGRALEHIRAAIAEAEQVGETDRLGELHERLANYLWEAGKRSESPKVFSQAATLLQDAPASAVKARVLAGIALGQLQAGRYSEGRKVADLALGMAEDVGAEAEKGRALNISGLALGMQGKFEAAITRLRQSLTIAQQVNRIEDLLRAYGNLGLVLEESGRLRAAVDETLAGLEEARQSGVADTRQGILLANNASAALVLLGEWARAEEIIAEASLDRPAAESLYPRLTLAGIKVARGDYNRARDLLASIENLDHGADPRFLGPWHTIRAELALGEGDLDRAVSEVMHGVTAVRNGENAVELLRLCAVGMRCAADQAGRATPAQPDHPDPMAVGAHLAGLVAAARPEPPTSETAQLIALCGAERHRIRGKDTDALWNQVAEGWDRLDRRYPAAYARWRQAQTAYRRGDDDQVRESAFLAHEAAQALGAEPLRQEVARFAEHIGLDLPDRPIEPTTPYGLTEAESQILRLMVEDHDTSSIAQKRGVSKRTVQTQQRSIYQKLEVHSASEARRKARTEGLAD